MNGPSAPAVRRLEADEVPEAAALLASAFDHDPFNRRLLPDAAERRRVFELNGRLQVQAALPYGHVFVVGEAEALRGIAVWLPPGATPGLSDLAGPLVGALPTLVATMPTWVRAAPRLARLAAIAPPAAVRVGLARRRVLRGLRARPLWHLAFLATDPAHQGRGIGRRLLDHVLDRVDRDHSDVWLETTDPANVGLYARFGFTTLAQVEGGEALPSWWILHRAPQPQDDDAPAAAAQPRAAVGAAIGSS